MISKLKTSISILIITLVSVYSFAQNHALPEIVRHSIEKRIEYNLNGAIAIGIIDQDGIRYYNFGARDRNGAEVNEHTIFEIGSITKTFTATMLAAQETNGTLGSKDLVNDFLPDSVQISVVGDQEITLGHLSDHTSGLPRMPANINPTNQKNPFSDYTVANLYDFISFHTTSRAVGTAFEYSNLGVGLLGHVLTLKSGKTYEAILREVITGPLAMKETAITLDSKMEENLAEGRDEFGRVTGNWDFPTLTGAGAIRSSTSDMLTYLSAQLGHQNTPLAQAIALTHQKRHYLYPVREGEAPVAMGLGWTITCKPDGDIYWHTGVTGGYKSFIAFNKTTQKGVIVFGTGDDPSDIGAYLMALGTLKEINRSLSNELARKLDSQGVESAKRYFENSVLHNLEEFTYGSYPLNRLGNTYLNKNNIQAAMTVFEINLRLFPDSWNVYDSYGAALRKTNQLEKSLENYRKSVALNPQNQAGVNAIAEIEAELGENR